jgi:hypothetical protein
MAARIDADDLGEIIALDEAISSAVAIETAHLLVEDHCSGLGYDEDRLVLLEKWLAAHLYAVLSPQIRSEAIGPISESFVFGQLGKGLDGTMYGQQALRLDSARGLARHDEAVKVGRVRATMINLGVDRNET